jgi:hypothetical protein
MRQWPGLPWERPSLRQAFSRDALGEKPKCEHNDNFDKQHTSRYNPHSAYIAVCAVSCEEFKHLTGQVDRQPHDKKPACDSENLMR